MPKRISLEPCLVESIRARRRRMRTMRGWTQVQCAEQSGLLQPPIPHIESGAQQGRVSATGDGYAPGMGAGGSLVR